MAALPVAASVLKELLANTARSRAASVLKELLANPARSRAAAELQQIWKFEDDSEWIKRNPAKIRSLLRDAERRSIEDEAAALSLAEIRAVCCFIQDMLDLCSLQSRKLVWPFNVPNFPAEFAFAPEMKEIRGNLNYVEERKSRFHFLKYSSALDLVVFGSLILRFRDSDWLFVISMMGMFALGKTTLAKLILTMNRLYTNMKFCLNRV